jgi:hypothetical protein
LTRARFSLNLCVPNDSSVRTCAIRDFDPIVLTQFLPLRSIGANLDGTAVFAHPDFYDPLFVIGRPLVFDFLALFYRGDVILPDHDRVAIFPFATGHTMNNSAAI